MASKVLYIKMLINATAYYSIILIFFTEKFAQNLVRTHGIQKKIVKKAKVEKYVKDIYSVRWLLFLDNGFDKNLFSVPPTLSHVSGIALDKIWDTVAVR